MISDQYNRYDTIVIAIHDAKCRHTAVNGFGRQNAVYDAYKDDMGALLDIPCFVRLIDRQSYAANAIQIEAEYLDSDANPPLLFVFDRGDIELLNHPLIIDAYATSGIECKRLYDAARRRAKRDKKTQYEQALS